MATKGKEKDLVAAAEVKSDTKAPKEKEKKEKKRHPGAAGAADGKAVVSGKGAVGAEDAGEPVPSMIDLRVGHIVDGKLAITYICRSSC